MNLLRRVQRLDDRVLGTGPRTSEERLAALGKIAGMQRTYPGITAKAILDLAEEVQQLRRRVEQLEASR
jgi:hypothetical protein